LAALCFPQTEQRIPFTKHKDEGRRLAHRRVVTGSIASVQGKGGL
jgi:hypothetical protein